MGAIIKLYPAFFSKFRFEVPDADLIYSSLLTVFGNEARDSIVSSAFPFLEIGGKTTFFMPFKISAGMKMFGNLIEEYENSDYGFVKRLKKAMYFDPAVLSDGKIDVDALDNGFVSPFKIPKFVSLDEETHNTVDRGMGLTTYYTVKFTRFLMTSKIKSGLWFYYDGPLIGRDFSVMRIGGEIGLGAGYIEKHEVVDVDRAGFTDGNILVSTLVPTSDVPDNFTFREKIRMFGTDEGLKIKRVRVVEEGHIFESKDSGKILDIGNKVLYGKGVYLGIENV